MQKLFAYFLAALVYVSPIPKAIAQESGYVPEPWTLRSEGLSQLFRSSPFAQRFQLTEAGDSRVTLSRTYSNYWSRDVRYIVDAETRDDVLKFHYQPNANLELYGVLSERGFTKSGTDDLAMNFHRVFGLSQDGRLEAPRNNTRLSVPDWDLNYTTKQSRSVLSRQVEVGAVFDLNKIYSLGLPTTLAVFTSYETAPNNPYFTGAIDGGFRLSSALAWEDYSVYGSLSLGIFDRKKEVQVNTRERQWGGIVGTAYRFNPRHEAALQMVVFQPLFYDMGQLSRESYEVHLAYRFNYEQVSLELGLVENIFWIYNTPDWGMNAAITYRFGK